MFIRVSAGEVQPVCPAIVAYAFGQFLAELQDEWDRGDNQDDAEDDKKQARSQQARQECAGDGPNRRSNLQEQTYAQVGQVIAHIRRCRATRCSNDRYNTYPDGILNRQSEGQGQQWYDKCAAAQADERA